MNQKFRFLGLAAISTLSINSALALPIDFSGTFGVDAHSISNLRRSKDDVVKYNGTSREYTGTNGKEGTQGIGNGKEGASFQTYVFKLNPQIIVNDGVTLKGEISSGYIRGGFAGGEAGNNADGSSNNAYFFTSPAQRSGLNLNQMYAELYADTALVKIGRFAKGYGTGMTWSAGTRAWDRFFTMYDGIEAEMKIGNFSVIPHFAKISSYRNNNSNSAPSGENDVRELGLIAKYDNKNRDLVASVLYAKRSSEPKNTLYNSSVATPPATTTNFARGKSEITVIQPYVSKKWNKLKIEAEASLQSGDYGTYDSTLGKSKLSASAYIVQANYELNPKWDLGAHIGQVSGNKDSTGKFEASYLNPNYHIAELMFRYNYAAFTEPTGRSIFDSSITNTRFAKLYGNFKTDKWTWKAAFIMAKAMETSSGSGRSYHHEEGYAYNSNAKQNDDMGMEIDLGFDYRWNPNVIVSAFYGFWKVGDYYAFTNDSKELSLTSVHGGGVSATVEF